MTFPKHHYHHLHHKTYQRHLRGHQMNPDCQRHQNDLPPNQQITPAPSTSQERRFTPTVCHSHSTGHLLYLHILQYSCWKPAWQSVLPVSATSPWCGWPPLAHQWDPSRGQRSGTCSQESAWCSPRGGEGQSQYSAYKDSKDTIRNWDNLNVCVALVYLKCTVSYAWVVHCLLLAATKSDHDALKSL